MNRTIFLTPGLVELGQNSQEIHYQIAQRLIDRQIDLVILVETSSSKFIGEYIAKKAQENTKTPKILTFKTAVDAHQNLQNILQEGDVILFQNDWTDNYT
jgi:UDP-N-acetylmuramyl pentapeptide synthase